MRREQVGLYIHTHSHIHIPRTFHGKGKKSPAHAKIGRIHKPPSLKRFNLDFLSPSISVFLSLFFFTYSTVLPGRLRGKGSRGSPAWVSHFIVSYIFSFHFISRLSLISS